MVKKVLFGEGAQFGAHCFYRPGKGALAKHGDFWYPVKLIEYLKGGQQWRIRWWRGCKFQEPGYDPGSISDIPADIVVDSLWRNCRERRSIRVHI